MSITSSLYRPQTFDHGIASLVALCRTQQRRNSAGDPLTPPRQTLHPSDGSPLGQRRAGDHAAPAEKTRPSADQVRGRRTTLIGPECRHEQVLDCLGVADADARSSGRSIPAPHDLAQQGATARRAERSLQLFTREQRTTLRRNASSG